MQVVNVSQETASFLPCVKKVVKKIFGVSDKRPLKLLSLEVNLANHCNLNCKGCSHFCPVAEERFYDIAVFERDCKRLSELTKRKINYIELMGGEPLLHPQVIEFMRIARKYFDGTVKIVTNGILLSQQDDEFWKTCFDNRIEIVVSAYPIQINIEQIEEKAKQYKVKIIVRKEEGRELKIWYHYSMDLDGKQDIKKNFDACHSSNTYIHLDNGRLVTCYAPLVSSNFNHAFGEKLIVSPNDYIDIYKAKNIRQIMEFLSKPIPFCRYCKPQSGEITNWEVSKKELSEWV
jgi:organic radical activating enzyme